jgi:hypothetical protein
MAELDQEQRKLDFELVSYGPALSGKTVQA